MKRFKGFGARRRSSDANLGNAPSSSTTTSVKSAASKNSSTPQDSSRALNFNSTPALAAVELLTRRRRSVDNSQLRESQDLQVVRREIWETSSNNSLQLGANSETAAGRLSLSESFSSASTDAALSTSSSRPWDAISGAAVSTFSISSGRDEYLGPRDDVDQGNVTPRRRSNTILGFDANSHHQASVISAVKWAVRSETLRKGDDLVLVGVMGYIRGPLGYKVLVHDQTWLGVNQVAVRVATRERIAAWLNLPGLKSICDDAGVTLVVDVKPAEKAETAIVGAAVAANAAHVVLDKSLRNRRRQYYFDHLACDVTRMRRSGGVDCIRSRSLTCGTITSTRSKDPADSPTSVLSTHRILPLRPPGNDPSSSSAAASSSSVQYPCGVEGQRQTAVVAATSSASPSIDEPDDLFSIDMALRINMLLAPQREDLAHHRRSSVGVRAADDDDDDDNDGYESDDLFSLAGDALASRRPSFLA